jgi:hypothetical protein
MAGSCEHGSEISNTIKGVEFIDQLSNCQLLKKESAALNLYCLLKLYGRFFTEKYICLIVIPYEKISIKIVLVLSMYRPVVTIKIYWLLLSIIYSYHYYHNYYHNTIISENISSLRYT